MAPPAIPGCTAALHLPLAVVEALVLASPMSSFWR